MIDDMLDNLIKILTIISLVLTVRKQLKDEIDE